MVVRESGCSQLFLLNTLILKPLCIGGNNIYIGPPGERNSGALRLVKNLVNLYCLCETND